jgi:hypothetical protein
MRSEDIRRLINLVESALEKSSDDDKYVDFYDNPNNPDEETVQKIHMAMDQLASFSNSNINYNIDQAYEIAMEHIPNARYTGVMYRGFPIDPEIVSDPNLVLSKIRQLMSSYARQVVSWSSEPDVAIHIVNSDMGVVVKQHATGIAVNDLHYEPTDYSAHSAFNEENEIFARVDNNLSIHVFVVDNEDDDPVVFPAKDLQKFLNFVKSSKT